MLWSLMYNQHIGLVNHALMRRSLPLLSAGAVEQDQCYGKDPFDCLQLSFHNLREFGMKLNVYKIGRVRNIGRKQYALRRLQSIQKSDGLKLTITSCCAHIERIQ